MNARGFEISFSWIFSIIVGGVVLFLAIYGVSHFVDTERTVQDSETAQHLGTLLTEVESSLESSARPGNISFPTMTRISNTCDSSWVYGMQKLSVATKSGVGKQWNDAGLPSQSPSRYIFSASTVEGKTISLYTAPLEMPFRIGTVIVLWTGAYCFVAPPTRVEDELNALHFDNGTIARVDRVSACPRGSTSVCFSGSGSPSCSIQVDIEARRVIRTGQQSVYYEDPLLFAAIMADPGIYECQIKRLFKRGAALSELYRAKSVYVAAHSQQGCSASMQPELEQYAALTQTATSRQLSDVKTVAQTLADDNKRLICPLWRENT